MSEVWETMSLRLCDDDGVVQGEHIKTLNELRWLNSHAPYEGDPFLCSGSMHLAGLLIRCDSPAHKAV